MSDDGDPEQQPATGAPARLMRHGIVRHWLRAQPGIARLLIVIAFTLWIELRYVVGNVVDVATVGVVGPPLRL